MVINLESTNNVTSGLGYRLGLSVPFPSSSSYNFYIPRLRVTTNETSVSYTSYVDMKESTRQSLCFSVKITIRSLFYH